MTEDKNDENNQKNPWWQPGLILFFKMSSWIGVPVLIAVFLGKFLDKKFKTEPWLFLLTVGVAFIFSMIALIVQGKREIDKIEREAREDKNRKNN